MFLCLKLHPYLLGEAEDDALAVVLPAGAGDAELANLGGVLDMGAGAEALVIIAHTDDADGLRGSLGQSL